VDRRFNSRSTHLLDVRLDFGSLFLDGVLQEVASQGGLQGTAESHNQRSDEAGQSSLRASDGQRLGVAQHGRAGREAHWAAGKSHREARATVGP